MRLIDGLNYRDWQKRNSKVFCSFSKKEQKILRDKGYRNIGWINIQKSWNILNNQVVTIFDFKLEKGDILGAINFAILESKKAKEVANESLKDMFKLQNKLDKKANETLAKYTFL